jgi:hypothetical protein
MRRISHLHAISAVGFCLAAVACDGGGGGGGGPGPVLPGPPASIVAVSPATQNATAGAAAAQPPSVRVTDARGTNLSGVSVTFAVTAGGGTITGGAATTDASGIATLASWTMGTAAAENMVTATVAGLAAVEFRAQAGPAAAATLAKTAGDGQTAAAGAALLDSLAVRVTDAFGNPVSGVAVAFAATAGGGSVSAATVTTNAQGFARTGLVLGTVAGANLVTATAAGLPAATFTATAVAGPAATMTKTAGDGQTYIARNGLLVRPEVRVADAHGNPVQGVPVTFAVTGGGGNISSTPVNTGADGRAAGGFWVVGPPGPQTLAASAPGVPQVTFAATALDPCEYRSVHTPFTVNTGSLSATDCMRDGSYLDFFTVTIPAGQGMSFNLLSNQFDAYLWLRDLSGNILAFNDDVSPSSPNPRLSVYAPAGTYVLEPTSFTPAGTGFYTLVSGAHGENAVCQGPPWVVPDITVPGWIHATDCNVGGAYTDRYLVYLKAGERIRVTQSSSQVNAYLRIGEGASGSILTEDDDSGPGDAAQLEFTASFSFYYRIEASTAAAGATGTYSLTVEKL